MVSAAALAIGPGGVELGSPGSLHGASPRQGPESSRAPRPAGADVRWRGVATRPQQHDSPRQRAAHLQFRPCASASKRGDPIASPRATSPRPRSAAANASSRLLRVDRMSRRRGCMPCGRHRGESGGGSVRRNPGPRYGRDSALPCQGGAGSGESAGRGSIRPVSGAGPPSNLLRETRGRSRPPRACDPRWRKIRQW